MQQQKVPWNGSQSKIHLYDLYRTTFKMTQKAKMKRIHKTNPK